MKKEFEDYIKRSLAIRHLSMPPEENGQNAADFYQLFNENFGKIKVCLLICAVMREESLIRIWCVCSTVNACKRRSGIWSP